MDSKRVRYALLTVGLLSVAPLSLLYLQGILRTSSIYSYTSPDYYPYSGQPSSKCTQQGEIDNSSISSSQKANVPWDSSNVVRGPPTLRYRDNLHPNLSYITSWTAAGFTNQFMAYVNLIYLGTISDRIPIVPPFSPHHHISPSAGILSFGEVFNLTTLRNKLRTPILEWLDVKSVPSSSSKDPYSTSEIEHVGCWFTRTEYESESFSANTLTSHLGFDASYTRVPSETRSHPDVKDDMHLMFSSLAALIYPKDPMVDAQSLPLTLKSPLGSTLSPDTHMACFDFLYYVTSMGRDFEWEYSWSPAWRFIGKHLHFTDSTIELGKSYLRKAFSWPEGELPPFISVHVRHGDFGEQCAVKENCIAPLSKYVDKVNEVKAELGSQHQLDVHDVIISSDEEDSSFWQEVTNLGWKYINHTEERTVDKYGEWHLPIIDVVHQSLSVGFVGTVGSTFSLVSQRRVEDWNRGVAKLVQRWS